MSANTIRCQWCEVDPLYRQYHDEEWGVPEYDDDKLFELLILEGAQAGLSWITVLRKRENYRNVFANFTPEKVAGFSNAKLDKILQDPGIIRNRLKVYSARQNAQAFLQLQSEFSSFANYLWRFVDGKPIQNTWNELAEVPASTAISNKLSKDLRTRGFTFVGPTIMYAYMQSAGLVNDHLQQCFRYQACKQLAESG